AQQSELAARYVESWPHLGALREAAARVTVDEYVFPPRRAGSLWFSKFVPPGADQAVLQVADEPGGAGRVLVDVNAGAGDLPRSLDAFSPSPDGRYVVYGVSEGGTQRSHFHIIETETGRELPDRIPHSVVAMHQAAWLPDASGFFYTAIDPRTEEYSDNVL